MKYIVIWMDGLDWISETHEDEDILPDEIPKLDALFLAYGCEKRTLDGTILYIFSTSNAFHPDVEEQMIQEATNELKNGDFTIVKKVNNKIERKSLTGNEIFSPASFDFLHRKVNTSKFVVKGVYPSPRIMNSMTKGILTRIIGKRYLEKNDIYKYVAVGGIVFTICIAIFVPIIVFLLGIIGES